MTKEFRDILLMNCVVVGAFLVWLFTHDVVPPQWLFAVSVGTGLVGQLALKAIIPDHAVLGRIPWLPLVAICVAAMVVAILFGQF